MKQFFLFYVQITKLLCSVWACDRNGAYTPNLMALKQKCKAHIEPKKLKNVEHRSLEFMPFADSATTGLQEIQSKILLPDVCSD
jgi:hypothetical protein